MEAPRAFPIMLHTGELIAAQERTFKDEHFEVTGLFHYYHLPVLAQTGSLCEACSESLLSSPHATRVDDCVPFVPAATTNAAARPSVDPRTSRHVSL